MFGNKDDLGDPGAAAVNAHIRAGVVEPQTKETKRPRVKAPAGPGAITGMSRWLALALHLSVRDRSLAAAPEPTCAPANVCGGAHVSISKLTHRLSEPLLCGTSIKQS